jgi:hypothetical protein
MARMIVRSTGGSVIALVLLASLLVPTSVAAGGSWDYPRLRLVVGHHDGKVYVGAQGWASDGCGSLVGSARGRRIQIKGMRYPESDGYACTTAFEPDWHAVRVPRGWTVIRVDYRGRTGKYSVRRTKDGVHIRHRQWSDTAAPAHERWWWEPEHGLIAHVWYGRPDAIERVSDRVDEMLRNRGARTFHTPEGWVISAVGRYISAPGERGEQLADGWTEELKRDTRTRVYLSRLTRKSLKRIAHRAAQTERCTYVSLARAPLSSGGVVGRPPCD